MTLGVDVGGTFTDLVWWDGERLVVGKTSTTTDQSVGVEAGSVRLLGGGRAPLLVHGTTVATNALLERRGARVALVTDPGFEDVIEIGRQDRPSLYDSDEVRPEALVPRDLRFGGLPRAPIDADAVAVVLLDSYADPTLERELSRLVSESHPDLTVVASADVSGEFREFERTSTTVLTAYLRPVVERYLRGLERGVVGPVADRVLVMQSSGGLVPPSHAGIHAASILLSGPAGGVVAAAAFGSLLGHDAVISFDMGGTSTDVCRIEGGVPEIGFERHVEGYVCRLPSVAVHTVGAGGGSVGWVDAGGALRVGPRSAGAVPGPVSYRRGGTEPAVTDADLLVGRLSPDTVLADGLALDAGAARRALAGLGGHLGLSAEDTAGGMIEIVEAHMERAVRRVSVEEGFDPSDAALIAFGGAGGMHASTLATRLGMGRVVIPPHAGVLSALGLLFSPPRIDRSRTVLIGERRAGEIDVSVSQVVAESARAFREAVGAEPTDVAATLDLRTIGQSHETSIPYVGSESWDSMTERFHDAHRRRNGFDRRGDPIEVVTVRGVATGRAALTVDQLPAHVPDGDAEIGRRTMLDTGGPVEAAVHRRAGLRPGHELRGPAVVLDDESTICVGVGERASLHPSGALVIDHA